jgi:tetratricopeptide (TPR) repeat protein
MPFVKKNDSKGSQPSTDGQKVFIGRNTELHFFRENILKPKDPTYNIVSVSGQGGVGKSTLLTRFIEEACKPDFKDYCLTALVDERQTTPAGMMEKFADQLPMASDFEKALRQYKEVLHKLQDEREAAREALLRKTTADIAGAVVKDVPFIGGILQEGVGAATGYVFDELRYRQMLKDAERLEDPVGDLTRAFVSELDWLTDTYVPIASARSKHRLRVILFFDTFEQLAAEAAPWLLNSFLEANISNQVVLVIAGRNPLEQSTPDDPKRWLPYHDDGTIYSIALNSFTEEETRAYLEERGMTDPDRINTIWKLSHGLPLYLGFLTSNLQGKADPTANVVANFLRWIPEQEHIKRQLALDAALFSKTFNQDDLEAFAYLPEQERPTLYRWLIGLPFIRSQDGHYRYHEVAQELFSRYLYRRSKKAYYASRRALADYYQQLLAELQQEGGKEVDNSREWLDLVLALAYQLFFLPDQASHIKAIEHVLNAYHGHTNEEQNREVVRALRDLSQEPSPHSISPTAREIAVQLLNYVETDYGSQAWLTAAGTLIEKVAHVPSFPSGLLAGIYYRRATAYNYTRSELFNREIAIENFQQALKLFESTNYFDRGFAYFFSGNYREALVVHEQALEQNPQDVDAYFGRGWAYTNLGEYERAIDDFKHVLELAPNYNNPDGLYNGLRWAYYRTGQYHQALSANDHLLEREPVDYDYYEFRSRCFHSLKDYQQSIDACNHALELAPNRADAYFQRGLTYLWLKDLGQAQADFTRSCELKPTKIDVVLLAEWIRMCQGATDPLVSERLEAIATVDLEDYTAHICLGIALLLRRNLRGALAELEQALRPTPYEEWKAQFWKGMVCAFLGQEGEAITALEKALDLELPPILLIPLRWFEQERPDFYQKYVVPLLARYEEVGNSYQS